MNRVIRNVVLWVCPLFISVIPSCSPNSPERENRTSLPAVLDVDLADINPDLFAKEEWYVPYYLKYFSDVANSVVDTGDNRGYINIVVWRTPDVNRPYNARIMESILSLVWFYTRERPWNPYYNDPALRKRIEAALTFWCNIQNEDGRFSEYGRSRWSLAPTAFATKFVGRALTLLEKGPLIDSDVMKRAKQSLRKALYIGFTDPDLWEHGRNYTNQYANLWGGASMYLKHNPDQTLDQLLVNRLDQSMVDFQSPCGYFYEKNGPDWGYNLSTHHSDLQVAWNYMRGSRLQDYIVDKTARWYDWFSYNAVKEPGASRYFLNKAVETRQQKWFVDSDSLDDPRSSRWTPQAEFVPIARAFLLSKEEYDAEVERRYAQMRSEYPNVEELKLGAFWSFSPYAFLHNELINWLPSAREKEQAVNELPYLKKQRFVQVRYDQRNHTSYSFVRQPSYYAILNAGSIVTEQQRFGLGLIWNPALGTVFQSQSKSNSAAWGTRAAGSNSVAEASDVIVQFRAGRQDWIPEPGSNEAMEPFGVSYPIKPNGHKSITFGENDISVSVRLAGTLTEVIPLLVGETAELQVTDNRIVLQKNNMSMIININSPAEVRKVHTEQPFEGPKHLQVVEVQAENKLDYSIRFNP